AARRLVVVGTGMAAMETVEEVLRRTPAGAWRVTMLGEEPGVPFNRMLLSKLLAGTVGTGALELRPPAWFADQRVDLRGGSPATAIDLEPGRVLDGSGIAHPFDALVLATGSRPFVPPIPGARRPGVLTFRTQADVAAIAASAQAARRAVVIGGGLLGLEAAAGIRACAAGATVTVLEAADRLMPQQLDSAAARLLACALDALGIASACGTRVERIDEAGVVLTGGELVAADVVVVAAGICPETTLAAEAGLEVNRGVLVDDELRTSAPGVWAVGECAEHRGTVYGLWAPLAEQARAAGASVCGDPAAFHGQTTATNLKVAGVELFAGGGQAGGDELVWSDGRRGVYRRLLLDGDRLAGAILVGDTTEARELSTLLRTGGPVPERYLNPPGVPADAPAPQPFDVICGCNDVTRETIEQAIAAGGLTSLPAVSRATRAATGCGSCAGDVERLLAARDREGSSIRNTSVTAVKRRLGTIDA
ncbi:MAG: FAD-dependent oxidoreductase, partial [Solirubrobacteraceae bacterium]